MKFEDNFVPTDCDEKTELAKHARRILACMQVGVPILGTGSNDIDLSAIVGIAIETIIQLDRRIAKLEATCRRR